MEALELGELIAVGTLLWGVSRLYFRCELLESRAQAFELAMQETETRIAEIELAEIKKQLDAVTASD